MISKPQVLLDDRDVMKIVKELLTRRLGYVPEWQPPEKGAGAALTWIFARYVQAIIQRLNQAPEKNKLAFLDLLGLDLVAAQAARTPIIFELSEQASDSRAPAGTQVAAPPPPESTEQVVFETERATGIVAARLTEVVSLWPGRDQYINHSTAFLAGEPFQLFKKSQLKDTPHVIYLAHDTLLALAGKVRLNVEFELTQSSAEPLDIRWQYWDGQVWRGFKAMHPICREKAEEKLDSTNGLTDSGRFRLETDCAETARTTVNGIEAFWIRGELTEPLPPDPGKHLPEVQNITFSSEIARPLNVSLSSESKETTFDELHCDVKVIVKDKDGTLLQGVPVELVSPNERPPGRQREQRTEANGEACFGPDGSIQHDPSINKTVTVSLAEFRASEQFLLNKEASRPSQEITFTLKLNGLSLDQAFSDGTALDVTKPFYPFGQQPQPGSTFYFNHEEIFSKPGAKVRIYVARTGSPQDLVSVATIQTPDSDARQFPGQNVQTPLQHTVVWEYWNGQEWVPRFQSSNSTNPPRDLNTTEIIDFTIPPDMVRTHVNEQEGFWMRVRLVSGGFGFKQRVTWLDSRRNTNEFTYVIPQPPVLVDFRLGYTWQYGPLHAEQVLTYNDFQYEDRTYEARWPGNIFLPFKPVGDVTPALYLGFDKKLPVDRLGMYLDIVEKRDEIQGPALMWEYWNGSSWRELSVEDETRNLRLPGILSFIATEDSQTLARFGTELYWLRGRLKEDGPPGEPTFNGIFLNAVWASQRQTFNDVPLGASSGLPNQVFIFTQIPVLADERIEVRELAGPRANVEWRILAMEIAGGDRKIIRDLEEMLGREGTQTDVVKGDLRLRRDRNKRVTEVWVHWEGQLHLFFSQPEDRHYVIDRAMGRLFFGDGIKGKVPPPGAAVLAKQFRSGGGLKGNITTRAISQLLGGVPGVQAVFNPRAAEGGADGETLETFSTRGPRTIRHRGRAIAPSDYETLAYEASPAVAVARAISTRNASGQHIPGWVTLLIIPQNQEPHPWPSFGLRQHVGKFIEEHAPADLAAIHHLHVTGPDYLPISVEATIAPVDPDEAGALEQRARETLEDFLHPLQGGPEGRGWELGRNVFLSDVAAVLERVKGVDYVEELALLLNGVPQGERVSVAEDRIVVAGNIRLKLKAAER